MTDYGPIDVAVQEWLRDDDTHIAATSAGRVYLAIPKSATLPVLLIRLIGGGPKLRADLPLTRYRLQFDCVDVSRQGASALARALIADLDGLGADEPGAVHQGVYLGSADVLAMRWQPDPDSDTPRYIVDALITTVQ